MTIEEMRKSLDSKKTEARKLLDDKNTDEAEKVMVEVRSLKAKIEDIEMRDLQSQRDNKKGIETNSSINLKSGTPNDKTVIQEMQKKYLNS